MLNLSDYCEKNENELSSYYKNHIVSIDLKEDIELHKSSKLTTPTNEKIKVRNFEDKNIFEDIISFETK